MSDKSKDQLSYHPIVAFCLLYAEDYIFCEVTDGTDNSYKVYFNGKYICNIEMAPNTVWMLSGGSILPTDIVEEIGAHIEGFLD